MFARTVAAHKSHNQRGFTLVELMISLLIGLFLLGGLITIVQTNRTVYGDQTQMAQLQDSERMALTLIADVVQSAGYFPDPTSNTAANTLTAVAPFAAGQTISGTYSAALPGDTLAVRYMTANGDGILNCSGGSNVTPGNKVYVNVFRVVNGQLVCTVAGVQYNLVSGVTNRSSNLGVTNLRVLYGVKTNLAAPGNNVDTYFNAGQMSATNWSNVISVIVSLTFTNPLYNAALPGQQPANITVQRVIALMNETGPTV